jgi:hypothetical protein
MSDETRVLLQFLDTERDHVLGILEGLSEEQLRRPVLPSGWNCLGLVKHLLANTWAPTASTRIRPMPISI